MRLALTQTGHLQAVMAQLSGTTNSALEEMKTKIGNSVAKHLRRRCTASKLVSALYHSHLIYGLRIILICVLLLALFIGLAPAHPLSLQLSVWRIMLQI
jgi:hypothetical protein